MRPVATMFVISELIPAMIPHLSPLNIVPLVNHSPAGALRVRVPESVHASRVSMAPVTVVLYLCERGVHLIRYEVRTS